MKRFCITALAFAAAASLFAGNPITHQPVDICAGQSITLTAQTSGDSYLWSTNDNTKSITVSPSSNETYTCTVTKNGTSQDTGNLISMGSFEFAPDQLNNYINVNNSLGVTVSYQYNNFNENGIDLGLNAVTTAKDPQTTKPNPPDGSKPYFTSMSAKDGEYMLVCDGTSDPGTRVWQARNIVNSQHPLKGGVTYQFSCWAANIDNYYQDHGEKSLPTIRFMIEYDGGGTKQIGDDIHVSADLGVWKEYKGTFTPTKDANWAHIWINNFTTESEGNDFALDDIYFGTVITGTDDVTDETFTVNVYEQPTVAFDTDDFRECAGEDVTLNVTVTGDYNSITWRENQTNLTAETGKTSITGKAPNAVGDINEYTVTVSSAHCQTVTDRASIMSLDCTVPPVIDHPAVTICIGETQTFTPDTQGASYEWSNTETTASVDVTAVQGDTNLSCLIYDASGKLLATENFTLTGRDCTIDHPAVTICIGETQTFTPDTQGATYEWSNTETTASVDVTAVQGDTNLTCLVYDANGKLLATENFTLTGRDCTINHPAVTLCLDETQTFTTDTQGASYEWSNQETTASVDVTAVQGDTNLSCLVYDANGRLLATENFTLTGRDCTIDHPEVSDCVGLTATLQVQTTGTGYTYSWDDGSANQSLTVTYALGTTNYVCTVYDANGKLAAIETFPVTGLDCPLTLDTQSTINTVCEPDAANPCNGTASVSISGGVSPYTISWDNGEDTNTIENLCNGTYTVTVTDAVGTTATAEATITTEGEITSSEEITLCYGETYNFFGQSITEAGEYTHSDVSSMGCTVTDTLIVNVISFENVAISTSAEDICLGESFVITLSGAPQGTSYSWTGNGAESYTGSSFSHTPTSDGNYNYNVTITNGNCTASYSQAVGVHPIPVLEAELIDATPLPDLQLQATGGTSPYQYVLDNTNTSSTGLYESVSAGYHSIAVSDRYGCSSDSTVFVRLALVPDKFFTPNGDGEHDLWNIKNIEGIPSHVYIYDRHQRLVAKFEPGDFHGWDGNYNGHQLPSADYWYVIRSAATGETMTGHFTLHRGK